MKTRIILWVTLMLGMSSVAAAPDIEAGKAKSTVCAACHSQDGNSVIPINPVLAGQHTNYIAKQLRNFKDPESGRSNATMSSMVAALSEEDMDNLAAFYASQTPKESAAKEAFVEQGQALYRGGDLANGIPACSGCHGPAGAGNVAAGYPKIRGQHAEYTAQQLKMFRSGERANDPNGMMRMVAKKMSDEQIQAVSEYLVGLFE